MDEGAHRVVVDFDEVAARAVPRRTVAGSRGSCRTPMSCWTGGSTSGTRPAAVMRSPRRRNVSLGAEGMATSAAFARCCLGDAFEVVGGARDAEPTDVRAPTRRVVVEQRHGTVRAVGGSQRRADRAEPTLGPAPMTMIGCRWWNPVRATWWARARRARRCSSIAATATYPTTSVGLSIDGRSVAAPRTRAVITSTSNTRRADEGGGDRLVVAQRSEAVAVETDERAEPDLTDDGESSHRRCRGPRRGRGHCVQARIRKPQHHDRASRTTTAMSLLSILGTAALVSTDRLPLTRHRPTWVRRGRYRYGHRVAGIPKRVLVIGGGGHARVCLDALADSPSHAIVGCVTADGTGVDGLPVPVLGNHGQLASIASAEGVTHVFVAVGDNGARGRIIDELAALGLPLTTAVSRFAMVSSQATVGDGVLVCAGAVVNAGATLRHGRDRELERLDRSRLQDRRRLPHRAGGRARRRGRRRRPSVRRPRLPRAAASDDRRRRGRGRRCPWWCATWSPEPPWSGCRPGFAESCGCCTRRTPCAVRSMSWWPWWGSLCCRPSSPRRRWRSASGSVPPVLFRQRRLGRAGRPFEMLKLRTMRPRSPPDRGTRPRMRRGTPPLGHLLRASSLDELPSLVNLLRGDISLVGHRDRCPSNTGTGSGATSTGGSRSVPASRGWPRSVDGTSWTGTNGSPSTCSTSARDRCWVISVSSRRRSRCCCVADGVNAADGVTHAGVARRQGGLTSGASACCAIRVEGDRDHRSLVERRDRSLGRCIAHRCAHRVVRRRVVRTPSARAPGSRTGTRTPVTPSSTT